MASLTAFAELRASIGDFKAKMGEATAEVQKLERKGGGSFSKLSAVGQGALLGIGTVAAGVGAASLHLADEFEHSQAQLQNALKNSGDSFTKLQGPINATNKRMEALGFTNAESEGALATLTTATGSGEKALNDMGLAANIARARNLSLGDAAQLVGKAAAGQARALKSFGIAGADALLKIKDPAQRAAAIMQLLNQKFGGAAQAEAATFAGKVGVLKAQVEDLGKNLGMRLIPVIEKVVAVTVRVVQWFEKHRTVAIAVGVVVGGILVAAVLAYAASMAIAAAATIAAMAPVLLIGAAVGLVGVLIYHFRDKFKTAFHDIGEVAKTVWHGITDTIHAFWAVVKPIFDLILKVYVGAFKLEFRVMKDVLVGAFNIIVATVKVVGRVFSDVFHAIGAVIGGVIRVQIGAIKGFINILISGINILIRALDSIQIHVPKVGVGPIHTPAFDWNGLNIPEIPHFQFGGTVPGIGPMLAVVHGGERITPANRVSSSSSDGRPVNIVVPLIIDGREIARATLPYTQSELIRLKNRSGVTGVA